MAAVLAGGPTAALSHASSAQHQGLDPTCRLGAIHVSLPPPSKRSPRGLLVHHPRELEPRDVRLHRGIPATTASRTLFDLCSSLSANALRRQFEQAEYLRLLDRPRLAVLLDGASGRRGLRTLRDLLAEHPLPLGETRSHLERLLLKICRDHGLPLPAVNVPLLGYEVDFLWPAARFVVEADGGQHRGRQRDRDNERDLALARAGYLVRRCSGEALRDEQAVASEIPAILRERLPTDR